LPVRAETGGTNQIKRRRARDVDGALTKHR